MEKEKKYLKQKDIPDEFPFLSKTTIIELIKEKDFPPGKKIKGRTIWTNLEIELWLDERN